MLISQSEPCKVTFQSNCSLFDIYFVFIVAPFQSRTTSKTYSRVERKSRRGFYCDWRRFFLLLLELVMVIGLSGVQFRE